MRVYSCFFFLFHLLGCVIKKEVLEFWWWSEIERARKMSCFRLIKQSFRLLLCHRRWFIPFDCFALFKSIDWRLSPAKTFIKLLRGLKFKSLTKKGRWNYIKRRKMNQQISKRNKMSQFFHLQFWQIFHSAYIIMGENEILERFVHWINENNGNSSASFRSTVFDSSNLKSKLKSQ